MNIHTWVNNTELQTKFDHARSIIADSDHRLSVNYCGQYNSNEIIAHSMCFDSDNIYLCSTVARKEDWPVGVYRILNRVFTPAPKNVFTKRIEPYWISMIAQQLEFCKELTDFRCAIISRQMGYKRTLNQLAGYIRASGIDCAVWDKAVWTCEDFTNPQCQQNVLAVGEDVSQEF